MSIATELKDAGALRLGVVGLGRAFTLMLPTLAGHRRVRMVAACDQRPAARDRFTRDFAARSYPTIEALCDDPDVQALYIATPHQLHAHHVQVAARAGKIILVTDPKGAAEAAVKTLATLSLPEMPATVAPLVAAIPVQLIAYHTAVQLGTDVDQPRNLAKSVTVE